MKYLKIILFFFAGAIGGIFAEQILWPYLVERPFFYKYNLDQIPYSSVQKTETIIQENTALQDAVEKIKKSAVATIALKNGKTILGSGIIVTSDGLMVSLSESLPDKGNFSFFNNGKEIKATVLKRDSKSDLTLSDLEGKDFPTVGFGDQSELRLGERIFMYSLSYDKSKQTETVKEGIVQSINPPTFETSFLAPLASQGSPIFDITGNLLGLAKTGSDGGILVIPVSEIKQFLGL